MTGQMLLLLLLLGAAAVAFLGEWLRVDMVALGVVAVLTVGGLLTPAEAFVGFASEVVVVLAALFILSGALVKTGVLTRLGQGLGALGPRRESTVVVGVMGVSAGLSAFISNTTATAILMPTVLEYSERSRLSPSRLLIPLAYASMLGGACTLIGTSTNLAASGLMDRLGLEPIGLFELAPIGLTMVLVGILWMGLVGHRFLPRRAPATAGEDFQIERYLSEVVLVPEAALVGQTLAESGLAGHDVNVVAIVRNHDRLFPSRSTRLREGDGLIVQATRASLLELVEQGSLRFRGAKESDDKKLSTEDLGLAEAIVMPRSQLDGRTPSELQFRHLYGIAVLAVQRRGRSLAIQVGNVRLQPGDVLLLQGKSENLDFLQSTGGVWVLGKVSPVLYRRRKGLITMGAIAGAVAASAAGWLPPSIAFLLAVLVVVLTRCVEAEEIYDLVEWRILVLIGGMTSLGAAIHKTGTDAWLAAIIAEVTAPLGVPALLAAFSLLTMLLTQPMSNAAAALVVLPVAVSTANLLGLDPRSFAILVTLSASLSLIAPLEPACLLVYSPGKYRFRDFVLAGLPLTALAVVILVFVVPLLWPLR